MSSFVATMSVLRRVRVMSIAGVRVSILASLCVISRSMLVRLSVLCTTMLRHSVPAVSLVWRAAVTMNCGVTVCGVNVVIVGVMVPVVLSRIDLKCIERNFRSRLNCEIHAGRRRNGPRRILPVRNSGNARIIRRRHSNWQPWIRVSRSNDTVSSITANEWNLC